MDVRIDGLFNESILITVMPLIDKESKEFKQLKQHYEAIAYSNQPNEQCLKAFRKVIMIDPDDKENLTWYASLLMIMNKFTESYKINQMLINSGYFHIEAYRRYGELLRRKGKI